MKTEGTLTDEATGRYWEGNAEAWTVLSRAGYDVYRDGLNTPAFFGMLPDIAGRTGLDVGCGEGHNTRLVAARGATMTGIDIAPTFIRHAQAEEMRAPRGIRYIHASAQALPFAAECFDFATAFMSLMDLPGLEAALAEVRRVLRPGGFLQFSVLHVACAPVHRRNLRDENGRTYAYELGGYFERTEGEVEEWIFSTAPSEEKQRWPKFKVPRFNRPLGEWINLPIAAGFVIEAVGEPRPSDETVARWPALQDAQVMPYFLHVRVRKPV